MQEINESKVPSFFCLNSCCFDKNQIKIFRLKNQIIITDGKNSKYLKGSCYHRSDGPAIDIQNYHHDFVKFQLNGFQLSEMAFSKRTNHIICLNCNKFCKQQCFY